MEKLNNNKSRQAIIMQWMHKETIIVAHNHIMCLKKVIGWDENAVKTSNVQCQ